MYIYAVMSKKVNQIVIFSPQKGATADEVMQVLKLLAFQTYPPELKTETNFTVLFNKLPPEAQRHFQLKDPQ